MAEKENKIEFGVENLHLAILKDEKTYETPEHIVGTVNIKLNAKGDLKIIYADNGVYFSLASNNGYEGELQIYNFTDDFKEKYFGFIKDGNGVLVEPSVLNPKPVAMAFKILGDEKDRVSVLYNCTFQKPDFEWKTLEDKLNVQVMKIKFKATPKAFENFDKKVVQSSTTNEELKKTWFTKVYIPSKEKTISV